MTKRIQFRFLHDDHTVADFHLTYWFTQHGLKTDTNFLCMSLNVTIMIWRKYQMTMTGTYL